MRSRGRAPRLEPPRSLVSVFLEAMPRRWPVIALAISSVVAAHWPTGGWSARLTAAPPQNPIFSTTSELVVLHATVKDRKGRYVTDLSRDAFTVFEDKAPQTISFFASDDAPVTVGLLIDSSGSMQSNLDLTIAAARSFVQISNYPG